MNTIPNVKHEKDLAKFHSALYNIFKDEQLIFIQRYRHDFIINSYVNDDNSLYFSERVKITYRPLAKLIAFYIEDSKNEYGDKGEISADWLLSDIAEEMNKIRNSKLNFLFAEAAVEATEVVEAVEAAPVVEAVEVAVAPVEEAVEVVEEAAPVVEVYDDTTLLEIYKKLIDVKNRSVYYVAFRQDMRKKKDNIQIIFDIDNPFTLSKTSKFKFFDDWKSVKEAEHTNVMNDFYQNICNITRDGKLHISVLKVKNLIKQMKPDIERQIKLNALLA